VQIRSIGDLATLIVGDPSHEHFLPQQQTRYVVAHENSLKDLLKCRYKLVDKNHPQSVLERMETERIGSQIQIELECLRSAQAGRPLRLLAL